MAFTSGNTILQINNIGTDLSANMEAKLITTIKKLKPKAKIKRKNRVNTVVITASKLNGSGIGATTLNDGLSFGTSHLEPEYKTKRFQSTVETFLMY